MTQHTFRISSQQKIFILHLEYNNGGKIYIRSQAMKDPSRFVIFTTKNEAIQHFIAFKQNFDLDSGDSGTWWLLLIINVLITLQL